MSHVNVTSPLYNQFEFLGDIVLTQYHIQQLCEPLIVNPVRTFTLYLTLHNTLPRAREEREVEAASAVILSFV